MSAKDSVRGAQVRSRLPQYIEGFGTPAQFRCDERPYKHNRYNPEDDPVLEQREPLSDEEWAFEKRTLEALTHILVQMSLMTDVERVKGYPSIHLS